ncbi:hypothetical protein HCN44_008808 [Aphidius gifuensis]|uniref:Uncharacterized protein n=1 Tax=Aphidius gifuensis TaxID=684658 RepID=A0A834XRJ7_APHGI|nr:uncharacterized protein LOC122855446 [Aphidius gifuensis]KAF7991496.1 hypothetical protein HCN44_008808 [Aphidius gifuensis]
MSQDYSYACQRAELLGVAPPSEEEWKESQKNIGVDNDDEEIIKDTALEDVDQSGETMTRIGGGLEELNSILNATQKKINRFKTVCGSIGSLLKVRVNSRSNTPDHKPLAQDADQSEKIKNEEDEILTIETSNNTDNAGGSVVDDLSTNKKIDLNEKMGSHLDKLDSLISKAEHAQYSMQHQTKQMKTILNK